MKPVSFLRVSTAALVVVSLLSSWVVPSFSLLGNRIDGVHIVYADGDGDGGGDGVGDSPSIGGGEGGPGSFGDASVNGNSNIGGGEGGPNSFGDASPTSSEVDAANSVNASLTGSSGKDSLAEAAEAANAAAAEANAAAAEANVTYGAVADVADPSNPASMEALAAAEANAAAANAAAAEANAAAEAANTAAAEAAARAAATDESYGFFEGFQKFGLAGGLASAVVGLAGGEKGAQAAAAVGAQIGSTSGGLAGGFPGAVAGFLGGIAVGLAGNHADSDVGNTAMSIGEVVDSITTGISDAITSIASEVFDSISESITGAPPGATISGGTGGEAESPDGDKGSLSGSPAADGGGDQYANFIGKNIATCPVDQKLCGTSSCIPESSVCCAGVGYPDRYCSSGQTCTASGKCAIGASAPSSCSALAGRSCTSQKNSCGMTNVERYACDGSCRTISPPDTSCPVPVIEIAAAPRLVNYKTPCTISWSVSNFTSCVLSGPNARMVITKANARGSANTLPLENSTKYTLSCSNGSVVKAEKSVSCNLNPRFNEI